MSATATQATQGFWYVVPQSVEETGRALREIQAAGLRIAEIIVAIPSDEQAIQFIDSSTLTWNASSFCDNGPQIEEFTCRAVA